MFPGDESRNDFLTDSEVFDQNAFRRQGLSDGLETYGGRSLEAGRFSLRRGKLAQGADEFVFVSSRRCLELFDTVGRKLGRAELLEFDPMVIPVQLLAQVADATDELALPGVAE